ncbi:MAG: hypothetical protein KAG61_13035 [Bacteriovoracaceae bacterium]|nr:hypothetical protein [Bacteriovoracaceae bacterium]
MRGLFNRNRFIFYGVGFGFILPVLIALAIAEVRGLNILYFASSYLWSFTVITPGVSEKVRSRRYRLSFLKIIYKYQQLMNVRLGRHRYRKYILPLTRISAPLFCFGGMSYITGGGNPGFALFGALYFELILLLIRRMKFIRL